MLVKLQDNRNVEIDKAREQDIYKRVAMMNVL